MEESPDNDLERGDVVNEVDDDVKDVGVSDKAPPRRCWKEWQYNHPWMRNVLVNGEDLMNCSYCMECKAEGVFGVGARCSTMLGKSLVDHEASHTHRASMKRAEARDCHVLLEEHVSAIKHRQQNRIEAAMKIAWTTARMDLAVMDYENFYQLARDLKAPEIHISDSYSTYSYKISDMEFI